MDFVGQPFSKMHLNITKVVTNARGSEELQESMSCPYNTCYK